MTRTVNRISALARSKAVFGVLAAAAVGAITLAGPATSASAAPTADGGAASQVAPAKALPHDGALQTTYYYCAPAATRIALSAHGLVPSHDTLAAELGTTTNGTDSANEVTRVLNFHLGAGRYKTTEISGKKATPEQAAKLQSDVVAAIGQDDPVVANIAGTIRDTAGEAHSYQGGHYLTVTGYSEGGRIVTITDPADTVGSNEYQMATGDLANWIATRGYSS